MHLHSKLFILTFTPFIARRVMLTFCSYPKGGTFTTKPPLAQACFACVYYYVVSRHNTLFLISPFQTLSLCNYFFTCKPSSLNSNPNIHILYKYKPKSSACAGVFRLCLLLCGVSPQHIVFRTQIYIYYISINQNLPLPTPSPFFIPFPFRHPSPLERGRG